jgi:SWI/SNF-related matrix-associated actin-dependent regulator of chromatin subfamily A-like protein 1
MAPKDSYDVIISFGKHKGKSLGFLLDSDPSYVLWMSNAKMPGDWSEAARRVIAGESVAELNLPKSTSNPKKLNVNMWVGKKDRINVTFAYDKEVLERFKFEIDGRKWEQDDRCWVVPAPQVVKMVELFGGPTNITADAETKKLYREEKARRTHLDEIRDKEDTDLVIDTKLSLYPYQKVAVEFINRAGGRAMVADQMGLGKTATAIGYAHHKLLKTLIICPKSVVVGWTREIERFTGKKATVWTSTGKLGRIDAQYHIINYDIVEKRANELRAAEFDLLVCDEATFIKNRKTKRAKSILGDYKQRRLFPGIKTKHVIFLTGTPVMNRPIEAFVLLNFLDSTRFNNFFHFTQKYGGWKGEDPRNLDDLHNRTKDLIIRRLKKDILSELPPKQRNDLFVELTPSEMKEYNVLLNKLFRKWKSLGKPTIAEMPAIQNYLIEKKMPRLIEMVDEMLEQDRGVLIYSCYVEPLKKLVKHYGDKAALVYGQMNTTQRQKSIDALKDGTAKVGCFSIGAGAMGIDGLQQSIDTVIFLDRWWVPSIHEQAEDRLFRIGQTKQVSAYYMTCEGTIDEYMGGILKDKQEMIDRVVDGKVLNFSPERSFFKEFVQTLKREYAKSLLDVNDDVIDDDFTLEI